MNDSKTKGDAVNKPKVILGFLALLSIVVLTATSSPVVDLTGTWIGSIDTGGTGVDELTLVLKKAEKLYKGTINDSLGMIDKDFVVTEVALAGNEFSFSFKALGGSMEFAMKLTVNGDKMTGELVNKAEGQGAPFEFVRKK
jgi:hypothetical protein